jgi:selenide,water dikinase
LLAKLPRNEDPDLLVGYHTNDDAGIYRLNDELALVTTADFITPPVNDPYLFGEIAAANALSDVYAMGGRPVTCLNLVCFPSKKLPPESLYQIVAGALSKISEAGAVLAGGHSIDDDEPKFGLAVTGVVQPGKYWTNAAAKPGDVLILTKPIGSGVLFNANLKGWVSRGALAECLEILCTLNKAAAEVLHEFDVHAVTDITGFGLAGHALGMAKASGVCLEVEVGSLPVMQEALQMYEKGMSTGSNANNRKLAEKHMSIKKALSARHEEILFDPQTSGGLLAAVPERDSAEILRMLHARSVPHAVAIGHVLPYDGRTHLLFT